MPNSKIFVAKVNKPWTQEASLKKVQNLLPTHDPEPIPKSSKRNKDKVILQRACHSR